MSFLSQQLPVGQNGRNGAIIFLPSNIEGKPAPELMTASILLLKTQLWGALVQNPSYWIFTEHVVGT